MYQVIRELVNNDKFYCDGDLGMRMVSQNPRVCEQIEAHTEQNCTYFCKTFADFITKKSVNCTGCNTGGNGGWTLANVSNPGCNSTSTVNDTTIRKTKKKFDTLCKNQAVDVGQEIVASDGVVYYSSRPWATFGQTQNDGNGGVCRSFSPPGGPVIRADQNGIDIAYKTFCIDVDGFPAEGSANCDDAKDICPFGFGIRADGKILNGARADIWIKKDIQNRG